MWIKHYFRGVGDRFAFSAKASNELWYNYVGPENEKERQYHLFHLGWYERDNCPDRIIILSLIVPFVSFRIGYRREK